MAMTSHRVGTVVEVFNSESDAQAAVRELKELGFTETQIGIVSHWRDDPSMGQSDRTAEIAEIEEMAATGAVAGLGVGALWGLGVLAGMVPGIGPAIVGGTLGVILSSAATGAAAMGVSAALISVGVPQQDASRFEDELQRGKTIVSVRAGSRADIASSVLNRFNGVEQIGD